MDEEYDAEDRSAKLPVKHPKAIFQLLGHEQYAGPAPQRMETPREAAAQRTRLSGRHKPPRQKATPIKPAAWEKLVETLRLHRRRLLSIPGVTAVDIGYKLDAAKRTFCNEVALRVHVERKLPLEYFKDHPDELISVSENLETEPAERAATQTELAKNLKPRSYQSRNGIDQMDILEARYRPSASPAQDVALAASRQLSKIDRRRRLDPLVGGISIGSPSMPVGTLGALVWDKTDGSVCILSNWHVLAGNVHAEAGFPCLQPGRFDRGRSSDVVARLKRWSFDNETDAAIAQLTGNRHYCAGDILDLYQQITGVEDPCLGMVVRKSGRSSGVTWGFVDGLHFFTIIQYSNGMVREFEDQIHIAPLPPPDGSTPVLPISDTGDSGSVWVTKSNGSGYRAVGLHFAGDLPRSSFGEYALANPMRTVEERLNISFRPLFLEIRDQDVNSLPLTSTTRIEPGDGNGAQPIDFSTDRLTRTGPETQGDQIPVRP